MPQDFKHKNTLRLRDHGEAAKNRTIVLTPLGRAQAFRQRYGV